MQRLALLGPLLLLLACNRPAPPLQVATHATVAATPGVLRVPYAKTAVAIEQHDDDLTWQRAVTTGPLREAGKDTQARPYSNARLLWDEKNLYLSLYAADQDIQAPEKKHDAPLWLHDAFAVRLQLDVPGSPVYLFDVAPSGAVTDLVQQPGARPSAAWQSGARVSIDVDGTVNDATGEDDEEWVVFVALPWQSLGIAPKPGLRLRASVGRCDVPKGGERRCGEWGGPATGNPQGMLELGPQAPK